MYTYTYRAVINQPTMNAILSGYYRYHDYTITIVLKFYCRSALINLDGFHCTHVYILSLFYELTALVGAAGNVKYPAIYFHWYSIRWNNRVEMGCELHVHLSCENNLTV